MPDISLEQAKKDKLFYVVASAVVYRRSDGRCLILKRDEREKVYPGRWALPGGKLEWADLAPDGSMPQTADAALESALDGVMERLLAREIKEEAGIDVAPGFHYLGSRSFVRPDGIPVILFKYAAEYKGGEVVLEEGAFTDHAWVTTADVRQYDCLEGIPDEIEKTIEVYERHAAHASQSRRVTIALALIRNAEGLVYLQQRNDPTYPTAHGRWDFPGGEVDFGEMPEETVRRECKEEIGCEVEVIRMLPWVRSHTWERNDGVMTQVFALCYECRIVRGTPKLQTDEAVRFVWANATELSQLDTLPGIREFISHAK